MTIPQDIIDRLNGLDIEDVASKLGLEVKRHKALCFMHNDHTPSISFSRNRNIYWCWVCGKGGGPIKLVCDKEGWNFNDACIWLAEQFNIWLPHEVDDDKHLRKRVKRVFLPKPDITSSTFDEELFLWLINNTDLLEEANRFLFSERHFKEDVIRRMKITSISNPKVILEKLIARFGLERCVKSRIIHNGDYGTYLSFYTPCLLFPYFTQDGRLVGIQSRYLGNRNNAPRFQFLSAQKTRLFNLPILNSLHQGERLYISEGITDCLALSSAGLKAVAIPSATILPQEDLTLLREYDLHIFPDQDDAGQKAFLALRRFFVNHFSTIKAEQLPESAKDFCDYYVSTQE